MNSDIKKQNDNDVCKLRLTFEALSVYRKLMEDEVISKLCNLVDFVYGREKDLCDFVSLYNSFYFRLSENNPNLSLMEYITEQIISDENIFTLKTAAIRVEDIDASLVKAVKRDLQYLQKIASVSSSLFKCYSLKNLCNCEFDIEIVQNLPEWAAPGSNQASIENTGINSIFQTSTQWTESIERLAEFHKRNGTGIFTKFTGFVWEVLGEKKHLKGISSPDPVRFSDLIGYERERSQVINNTVQFLKGFPANNILLYGDRGTGKSSTVKALLNEYHPDGLRMIEIPRRYLTDFSEIIRAVKDKSLHFIFFIDDLAFEDNEESYTALKAILEGGLETRPRNVLIYATSNRRHLIKEKFSDRAGIMSSNTEDEVRAMDTLQEKLSLADRFGITVTFSTPDQKKYLEIVEGLVKQRNLDIDRETLHREAIQWEMSYNGRSPRTARQFVDWLEGKRGKIYG